MLRVISSPEAAKDEAILSRIFFEAGLRYFHLRKPGWSYHEMGHFIEKIPIPFHAHLVVHSRFSLRKKYPGILIHLPERVRIRAMRLLRQIGPSVHSSSFHSLAILGSSHACAAHAFLSPVFPSISKVGHVPQLSERLIRNALIDLPRKVVALGGITLATMPRAAQLGFSEVALLGAIWTSADPVITFHRMQECWSVQERIKTEARC